MLYLLLTAAILAGTPAGVPIPAAAGPAGPVSLEPGDPAPPFTLKGSDGRTYRLQDFRGKRAVVLAWFAKASSAG